MKAFSIFIISAFFTENAYGNISKDEFDSYRLEDQRIRSLIQCSDEELEERAKSIAKIVYANGERQSGSESVLTLLELLKTYLGTGDFEKVSEDLKQFYGDHVPGYLKSHALLIRYIEKGRESDMKEALSGYPKLFETLLDLSDSQISEYASYLISLDSGVIEAINDGKKKFSSTDVQKTISEYFDEIFNVFLSDGSSGNLLFLLSNFERYAEGASYSPSALSLQEYEKYGKRAESVIQTKVEDFRFNQFPTSLTLEEIDSILAK